MPLIRMYYCDEDGDERTYEEFHFEGTLYQANQYANRLIDNEELDETGQFIAYYAQIDPQGAKKIVNITTQNSEGNIQINFGDFEIILNEDFPEYIEVIDNRNKGTVVVKANEEGIVADIYPDTKCAYNPVASTWVHPWELNRIS